MITSIERTSREIVDAAIQRGDGDELVALLRLLISEKAQIEIQLSVAREQATQEKHDIQVRMSLAPRREVQAAIDAAEAEKSEWRVRATRAIRGKQADITRVKTTLHATGKYSVNGKLISTKAQRVEVFSSEKGLSDVAIEMDKWLDRGWEVVGVVSSGSEVLAIFKTEKKES